MFELTLVKRRRRASHVTSLKRALKVIQAWRSSNAPQTWPPWNVPQTCSIRAADVRQTCRKGDSTRFKSDVLQTWHASNVKCLKSSVPQMGCKRASHVLHTYPIVVQMRLKFASNVPDTCLERDSDSADLLIIHTHWLHFARMNGICVTSPGFREKLLRKSSRKFWLREGSRAAGQSHFYITISDVLSRSEQRFARLWVFVSIVMKWRNNIHCLVCVYALLLSRIEPYISAKAVNAYLQKIIGTISTKYQL